MEMSSVNKYPRFGSMEVWAFLPQHAGRIASVSVLKAQGKEVPVGRRGPEQACRRSADTAELSLLVCKVREAQGAQAAMSCVRPGDGGGGEMFVVLELQPGFRWGIAGDSLQLTAIKFLDDGRDESCQSLEIFSLQVNLNGVKVRQGLQGRWST
uniref:Uncharacterized protein n=1 Tax=Guillardia theta TaxID=55529 RepID=A0A7S4L5F5_GUITH|mmetsp:Transcript_37806/g.119453  ORF Transcript_37806/g.119453 Transcript_37806/m.119453 type:complete len:154 (+) Transcript_37806:1-462(+)